MHPAGAEAGPYSPSTGMRTLKRSCRFDMFELSEFKGREWMFRLNAFMRHPRTLDPPEVAQYSLYHSGAFQLPSALEDYQIIVSTCSSSGYLYRFVPGIKKNRKEIPNAFLEKPPNSSGLKDHFTHMFIVGRRWNPRC